MSTQKWIVEEKNATPQQFEATGVTDPVIVALLPVAVPEESGCPDCLHPVYELAITTEFVPV